MSRCENNQKLKNRWREIRDSPPCRLMWTGGEKQNDTPTNMMYFGYGAALFLLGFSAAGVALIPALSGAFGFFTMYTVSCFVAY